MNRLFNGGHHATSFILQGESTLISQMEWRIARSAEFALAGDVQTYVASGKTRRELTAERETLARLQAN